MKPALHLSVRLKLQSCNEIRRISVSSSLGFRQKPLSRLVHTHNPTLAIPPQTQTQPNPKRVEEVLEGLVSGLGYYTYSYVPKKSSPPKTLNSRGPRVQEKPGLGQ